MTLASLRLMTGRQLQRVFFADERTGSTNPRIARRCLQRLSDLGLLQRLDRRVGGLRAGSSSYVYALSVRGGQVIAEDVGRGRKREPGLSFVRHTLAVSEACVRLHEAQRAGQLAGLRIDTEPQCWRPLDGYAGGQLKPDLFVLAAVGEIEHLAFVEIDNDTEHGPPCCARPRSTSGTTAADTSKRSSAPSPTCSGWPTSRRGPPASGPCSTATGD